MKIAIIGAGFAGLTSARHLRDFGHDVTVFEKVHDVGGVWSKTRLYPGISTQNGKDTYHLSDYPMPKAYPEWPAGHQVQEYLAGYVRDFNLGPLLRLSTTVTAATQGADGRWTLTFRREGGDEQSEAFDFLTICNGIFSVPAVPEFAGADEFRAAGGTICHSSQFINLDEARGKHVIVIGYGKSSCDVAVGLADVTASMTVVARELIWKMPRKIAGVLNYKYLFLTRMGEALFPFIELKGFEKFLHGAGRPVRNSMLGSVQSVVTRQLKLKQRGALPRGQFERIARSTVSLVTEGFFERIESGRIVLRRDNAIDRLVVEGGRRMAVLKSGETIPADIIVCGTGWRQEVPFLEPELQQRFLDDRGNFRLYRHILPTGVRNLAFNGYNSSFFSPLSAEMGALWICALVAGALKLPPDRDQISATERRLRWMEERTEGKHARGTNIIPFSMHQIDELLRDMNLSASAMQRFMEWQMPVKPGNYARVARELHRRLDRR
ncbi:MAG: NAD(P)/FAD-dependent oxidoreductase [Rubellimicrobium sp.]|nr:NAD(P)/FAD-dependent oxidoreductase [Rubellimicrobium sp.]